MPKQLFSNNASTTLAVAITSGATSISVVTGKGALFNSPASGNYELLTITDGTNYEVVKCTARSGDVFTVTRGQESTTARAWSVGAIIGGYVTKGTLESLQISGSGIDSIAIGSSASSAGIESIAMGKTSSASGNYAVALGKSAVASTNAVAVGPSTNAGQGIAIGNLATSAVTGVEGCIAIGHNSETQNIPDSLAIGYHANVKSTLPIWQANHPYYHGDLITNTAGTKVLMMSSWSSAVPEQTFTSGATEPTWPTTRYTEVADGTNYCGWMYVRDVPVTLPFLSNAAIALGRRSNAYIAGLSVGDAAVSTDNGVAIAGKSLGYSAIAILGDAKMDTGIAIGKYSVVSTSDTSQEGNLAIGYTSESYGIRYCLTIGPYQTNRIADSHAITGYSLVTKAGGAGADAHVWNAGQENYIVGDQISLTQTAVDDLVVFTIPTNSKFFPSEFGFIVTQASGVTVNPQLSFGITGNTTSLVAQSTMDKTSFGGRKVFSPQANSGDGVSTAIKASLKVAATATTLSGRFYIKGLLVENQ